MVLISSPSTVAARMTGIAARPADAGTKPIVVRNKPTAPAMTVGNAIIAGSPRKGSGSEGVAGVVTGAVAAGVWAVTVSSVLNSRVSSLVITCSISVAPNAF